MILKSFGLKDNILDMKKLFFVLLCLSFSKIAIAQDVQNSLSINETYYRGTVQDKKAFDNIKAYNQIEPTAKVQYQAGKSVKLLPGFQAKANANFKAFIAPVTANRESEGVVMTLSAYPNPFVESTEIEYFLPAATKVNLSVSNITGQDVATLIQNEYQEAGMHKVKFTAYNLVEGGYQYTLKTDETTLSKRLVKK
jgi:hypothetical protein